MPYSDLSVRHIYSGSSVGEPLSLSDDPQLGPLYSDYAQDTLDRVEPEMPVGPACLPSEDCRESSDIFLGLTSYCFAKIERLQEELISTRRCLDAADSQLEDTRRELDAALHDLEHQKRMREHQQYAMDRIVESKTALEAKLDELESLLEADMNMYARFQQQTRQCIFTFEEEIHSLRSRLFEAKRNNILYQWRSLTLSDEVEHLTAVNALLKQKIAALEGQATDDDTHHSAVGTLEEEESRSCQSKINALEKQYFYFKSRYTEVERQCAKAQLDLTVMKSIIKGKDAEIKKLKEKLQSVQSATILDFDRMLKVDKEKVYSAAIDALAQIRISKEILTKSANTKIN